MSVVAVAQVGPGWKPWRRALWYNWAVFQRSWRSALVASFLYPFMYLASMGIGVGHLVSRHAHLVDGVSYLHFVAPALLGATVMQLAANECMWPILGGIKWLKTFHAALATPLEPEDLITGKMAFLVCRIGATGVVYTAVIAAFGGVTSWWGLTLPLVGIATGMAFATPLAAYSSTLEDDVAFAAINRFLIIPMSLFAATFFPLGQYPSWLRPVVQVMPLYHGVALSRIVVQGHGPVSGIVAHLVVLLGLSFGGLWLARRNFRARLVK